MTVKKEDRGGVLLSAFREEEITCIREFVFRNGIKTESEVMRIRADHDLWSPVLGYLKPTLSATDIANIMRGMYAFSIFTFKMDFTSEMYGTVISNATGIAVEEATRYAEEHVTTLDISAAAYDKWIASLPFTGDAGDLNWLGKLGRAIGVKMMPFEMKTGSVDNLFEISRVGEAIALYNRAKVMTVAEVEYETGRNLIATPMQKAMQQAMPEMMSAMLISAAIRESMGGTPPEAGSPEEVEIWSALADMPTPAEMEILCNLLRLPPSDETGGAAWDWFKKMGKKLKEALKKLAKKSTIYEGKIGKSGWLSIGHGTGYHGLGGGAAVQREQGLKDIKDLKSSSEVLGEQGQTEGDAGEASRPYRPRRPYRPVKRVPMPAKVVQKFGIRQGFVTPPALEELPEGAHTLPGTFEMEGENVGDEAAGKIGPPHYPPPPPPPPPSGVFNVDDDFLRALPDLLNDVYAGISAINDAAGQVLPYPTDEAMKRDFLDSLGVYVKLLP